MRKTIEIKLTNPFAKMPAYANYGDAGLDLAAAIEDDVAVYPGTNVMITSGIAVHINDHNVVGVLVGRSGLGHKCRIRLSNCVGIIDSSYQQTIGISVFNDGDGVFTIKRGDRIAQLLFVPVYQANLTLVDDFTVSSDRGGFGSSGVAS